MTNTSATGRIVDPRPELQCFPIQRDPGKSRLAELYREAMREGLIAREQAQAGQAAIKRACADHLTSLRHPNLNMSCYLSELDVFRANGLL